MVDKVLEFELDVYNLQKSFKDVEDDIRKEFKGTIDISGEDIYIPFYGGKIKVLDITVDKEITVRCQGENKMELSSMRFKDIDKVLQALSKRI